MFQWNRHHNNINGQFINIMVVSTYNDDDRSLIYGKYIRPSIVRPLYQM